MDVVLECVDRDACADRFGFVDDLVVGSLVDN